MDKEYIMKRYDLDPEKIGLRNYCWFIIDGFLYIYTGDAEIDFLDANATARDNFLKMQYHNEKYCSYVFTPKRYIPYESE